MHTRIGVTLRYNGALVGLGTEQRILSLLGGIEEFAKTMPELMAIVGMTMTSTTMVGFMSAYLYGFIMLVFPMVFSILSVNKLIAKHIDKGSMTYLLAAPVERKAVAFTQMKVVATGIFALTFFACILGIVACSISFPGELEIGKFILLNFGALCLQLFIAGICFLCSCIFNNIKYSIGLGAGIPALCFIIQMTANAGDKLSAAKYFTFFTLFNPNGLIALDLSAIWGIVALFIGAIALFVASIVVFSKKDLHI